MLPSKVRHLSPFNVMINKYYTPVKLIEKNCIVCNNTFLGKSHQKCCNHQCSKLHTLERGRKRHYFLDGCGVVKHCVCKTCGNTFDSNHKRAYCSPECRQSYKQPWDKSGRFCKNCGIDFTPKTRYQTHCNSKCNPYGQKYRDAFYQSGEWRRIRSKYLQGHTIVSGLPISHKYCIECYINEGRLNDMYALDHIVRRRDGGSDDDSNLQSLCRKHHQSKSAIEGNKERRCSKMV